jgi:hypothetical protein
VATTRQPGNAASLGAAVRHPLDPLRDRQGMEANHGSMFLAELIGIAPERSSHPGGALALRPMVSPGRAGGFLGATSVQPAVGQIRANPPCNAALSGRGDVELNGPSWLPVLLSRMVPRVTVRPLLTSPVFPNRQPVGWFCCSPRKGWGCFNPG